MIFVVGGSYFRGRFIAAHARRFSHADAHADTYSNTNTYARRFSHANAHPNPDTNIHADCDTRWRLVMAAYRSGVLQYVVIGSEHLQWR